MKWFNILDHIPKDFLWIRAFPANKVHGFAGKKTAWLSPRHLSRQHLSWGHLFISGISQMLLTRLLPNFKGRFLGTDANFQGYISTSNLCPGDICPYQQYLSYYWPDFDEHFWTHYFGGLNFSTPHLFLSEFVWTRFFFDLKCLVQKNVWTQNV